MKHSSCMTQYLEGRLVGRDLQQMMADYAADGRFERELEAESSHDRFCFGKGGNNIYHKEVRESVHELDFE